MLRLRAASTVRITNRLNMAYFALLTCAHSISIAFFASLTHFSRPLSAHARLSACLLPLGQECLSGYSS